MTLSADSAHRPIKPSINGSGGVTPPQPTSSQPQNTANAPKTATVTASSILDGLDKYQLEAAKAIWGPVSITAGAGAGKTRTITHRIAYACRSGEWLSQNVLAVTFTAKAAREMRERLSDLGIDNATVNTFHAQALKQVREYWSKATGTKPPQLTTNKHSIVQKAVEKHSLELSSAEIAAISDEIGWCKVSMILPHQYEQVAQLADRKIVNVVPYRLFVRLYDEYDNVKSELGMVDFEDIILLMIHLITSNKAVAKDVRETYKHIIVDEFQDVSPLQYKYLRCLLGTSREICVVGDPSQTIYSFTGASPFYLVNFEEHFKPTAPRHNPPRTVELLNDYRSTPQIVGLANKILKYRGKEGFTPLKLMSKAKDIGEEVQWDVYESDADQVKRVGDKIKRLIDQGIAKPSEIAILTRVNSSLADFGNYLRRIGVECYIKQDRKSPEEDSIPQTENIDNAVTLASLHSSKGLEWKCVFLACLADGQIPLSRVQGDYEIEEERRLLYVGVTRAKEYLYMSYALSREGGSGKQRPRSRFLDRIWTN